LVFIFLAIRLFGIYWYYWYLLVFIFLAIRLFGIIGNIGIYWYLFFCYSSVWYLLGFNHVVFIYNLPYAPALLQESSYARNQYALGEAARG